MAEPIKAGDLVVVVRNSHLERCHCMAGLNLGRVFIAAEVRPTRTGYLRCQVCNARAEYGGLVALDSGTGLVFELYRLKRIPPLGELDDVKQGQEITA